MDSITEITEDTWFLHAYRGGRAHLILTTQTGNRIGFFVRDNEAWKQKLHELIAPA